MTMQSDDASNVADVTAAAKRICVVLWGRERPSWETPIWDQCNALARAALSTPSTPAPGERLREARDAARWRALWSSDRIRMMGCAGFDFAEDGAVTPRADGGHHLGVEVWDKHPAQGDREDTRGRKVLLAYVDTRAALDAADGGRAGLYRIMPPDGREAPIDMTTIMGPALSAPVPQSGAGGAASDVLAERRGQVEVEGWTPEHDDEHANGELALAAALYAIPYDHPAIEQDHFIGLDMVLDLSCGWNLKPEPDKRRRLVKAGALILAEIERLDRAALAQPSGMDGGEG